MNREHIQIMKASYEKNALTFVCNNFSAKNALILLFFDKNFL